MECPVCRDDKARDLDSAAGVVETECRRSGRFRYTGPAWEKLRTAPSEKRALVCGWLWEQTRFGSVPTIDANIDALLSASPLPFFEKAKRLLIHLSDGPLGKPFEDLVSLRLDSMLETFNHNDINFVLNDFLRPQGLVEEVVGGQWRMTGQGFLKADEWKHSAPISGQAFVAMRIHDDMNAAWSAGLQKGISAAGYKPLRIDKKEHPNKICDEIISEIRRSRFLVADFTGHRGGVYYEAGYATGRGLDVFLTCKKDEMDDLHFDIRQYNCIDWKTPDDLAHRLQVRIEAVMGDGPFKPK